MTKSRKKELLKRSTSISRWLAERRNQRWHPVGGEQQMLAIARSMMLEPKIILLDSRQKV